MATESFASRLTELRKDRGLTQKKAAADLKVSQALLSHYENGVRECGLSFVVRAAEYYGVSTDYLLGRSGNMLSMDASPRLSDIPEDSEFSAETLIRTMIFAGRYLRKDSKAEEYAKSILGVLTYLLIYGGVKRNLIPKSWLGNNSFNEKQAEFLIDSLHGLVRNLEPKEKKPSNYRVPAGVRTVTAWVNDFLNLRIADIL